MKGTLRILIAAIITVGCLPETSFNPETTISQIKIINQEIILHGAGLTRIDHLKIKEGAKTYHLAIVNKSDTKIIAQPLAQASFSEDKIEVLTFLTSL